MPAGTVPRNPSDLLLGERMEKLMHELKNRSDYIIMDCAPVIVVSDTSELTRYADISLYVIEAGKIDKRFLHTINQLYKDKKLNNMSIIINRIKETKESYGYGYCYGYGYGNNEEKE